MVSQAVNAEIGTFFSNTFLICGWYCEYSYSGQIIYVWRHKISSPTIYTFRAAVFGTLVSCSLYSAVENFYYVLIAEGAERGQFENALSEKVEKSENYQIKTTICKLSY